MYIPTGQAKTEWRVSGPLAYQSRRSNGPELWGSVEKNTEFWVISRFLTSQIKAENIVLDAS
jgi:hypothetical protein